MKIAVIGAGAIGGLIAGYLKHKDVDVFLVARPKAAETIKEKGLEISGARGSFNIKVDVAARLDFKPDLVILSTKTQDLEEALKTDPHQLKGALILTTQNGVQADNIVAAFHSKENIVSSIVMFGATSLESGKILHNFEGSWILGMPFGKDEAVLEKITPVLSKAFTVSRSANIKGMKYLKVFVNANNCLPAILGLSIQEAFSDVDISAIAMSIWKEGLGVVQKAGLTLESLPDFPIERLMKLTSFSTQEAARVYSGIMQGLSREPLYGSVLQSIKRGKRTEIDYFNGEFVHLAKSSGSSAPLNAKLVEMVHEVEKTGRFFSKGELLQAIKGLNNKK